MSSKTTRPTASITVFSKKRRKTRKLSAKKRQGRWPASCACIPHNIAQKTEVIIEHFNAVTRHKIGGRAKAMVVTDSRLSAVRYKESFDAYIKRKGYSHIKTLVAFSGQVHR